jgi:hypothetical protein
VREKTGTPLTSTLCAYLKARQLLLMRPFSTGIEAVDFDELWSSIKLLAMAVGASIPAAGVVILAAAAHSAARGRWFTGDGAAQLRVNKCKFHKP